MIIAVMQKWSTNEKRERRKQLYAHTSLERGKPIAIMRMVFLNPLSNSSKLVHGPWTLSHMIVDLVFCLEIVSLGVGFFLLQEAKFQGS